MRYELHSALRQSFSSEAADSKQILPVSLRSRVGITILGAASLVMPRHLKSGCSSEVMLRYQTLQALTGTMG